MEDKMENKNELTITFNISDSLLEAFAKVLLLSNSPPMMGMPPQMVAALQAAGGAERPPIGFAPKGKKNEI
tara:strand:- start:3 stop:215 length:213 start_codon:yes stop_codon:yes gene_type:complete